MQPQTLTQPPLPTLHKLQQQLDTVSRFLLLPLAATFHSCPRGQGSVEQHGEQRASLGHMSGRLSGDHACVSQQWWVPARACITEGEMRNCVPPECSSGGGESTHTDTQSRSFGGEGGVCTVNSSVAGHPCYTAFLSGSPSISSVIAVHLNIHWSSDWHMVVSPPS